MGISLLFSALVVFLFLPPPRSALGRGAWKCNTDSQQGGRSVSQRRNTEVRQRERAVNQEAGGKVEQRKNTKARQRKRTANQEASGKAEQGMNTEARQRKRAEIRERAKTEIQH